ncbi:signal peptidase I [Paenarthrobacter aromaticivorans]|uniref:signal peptidase I n=1 Tax=Paenarthrobacter aromaticivorans TaxID=2849150 RepID=UPI003A8078BD
MVAPSSLKDRNSLDELLLETTLGTASSSTPVFGETGADVSVAVEPENAEPQEPERLSSERTSSRRLLTRVGRGLGVVLLSLALLAVTVLIMLPKVTGSQTYSVLTNSMAPKYAPGTFLVSQAADFDELKLGDVITYQIESGKPGVITHRIVGFGFLQTGEKTLTTKGDNNDVADPQPVREIQVRGKLLYAVPFVGFVANALGNSDRSLWLAVGAVGLIGYGGFTMLREVRSSRKERQSA